MSVQSVQSTFRPSPISNAFLIAMHNERLSHAQTRIVVRTPKATTPKYDFLM